MGKLIKIVILLAVVAGGIALAVHYAGKSQQNDIDQARADRGTRIQPQEKYGFAPVGDDE